MIQEEQCYEQQFLQKYVRISKKYDDYVAEYLQEHDGYK